jgi:hypothetical protein
LCKDCLLGGGVYGDGVKEGRKEALLPDFCLFLFFQFAMYMSISWTLNQYN